MLRLLVITLVITSCAYKPVVDHRGNKGQEVAFRYNDDLQTCKSIAKENTNSIIEFTKIGYNWYLRPQLLWLPDKAQYSYKAMVQECLQQRGHSVLK